MALQNQSGDSIIFREIALRNWSFIYRMMICGVFSCCCKQIKVFGTIIVSNLVDVVDSLAVFKKSAKCFFSNKNVFINSFFNSPWVMWLINRCIATRRKSFIFSLSYPVTFMRAIFGWFSLCSPAISYEGLTTSFARRFNEIALGTPSRTKTSMSLDSFRDLRGKLFSTFFTFFFNGWKSELSVTFTRTEGRFPIYLFLSEMLVAFFAGSIGHKTKFNSGLLYTIPNLTIKQI